MSDAPVLKLRDVAEEARALGLSEFQCGDVGGKFWQAPPPDADSTEQEPKATDHEPRQKTALAAGGGLMPRPVAANRIR